MLYSYVCLSCCFPSFGLGPDTWRVGRQDVFWRQRLFLQQFPILRSVLRAVLCAGWSWSPAALTATWLQGWAQATQSVSMPAARANGDEDCKPQGWLPGRSGAAEVMVPLMCLGLRAATWGSAQGSCQDTHYTPACKHTSVELCICHRLIGICGIKVSMNGQEPCFRRCAQCLKWEAKCRRFLHLLWTCCHSPGLLEIGGPEWFW